MSTVIHEGELVEVPARRINEIHLPSGDPSPEIRIGLIIAGLFFVLFLGWASVARLDAAAMAPGHLTVSGQRQTIQHREGGVISEILVKEGSRVEKGQVLIRLSGADVKAQESALAGQAISLLAQRARLRAEQSGSGVIVTPPEFAALTPEELPAAAEAMKVQRQQMRARAAVLSAQRGASGERTSQANSSGQGYGRQIAAIDQQIKLIDQELAGMQEAAAKGFVAQNRLRELERARAELEGQRGQYAATVDQTRGQAGESRLQGLEAQSTYFDKVTTDLREVEASLADVLPKLNAAKDELARIEIRAPVSGTVVGLTVFTPGGVIEPGQKLMDIVPDRAPLTIEAKLSATDGDDVHLGQDAFVRFDSLHERSLPPLKGKVSRVSADAFTDEKTGVSFYTAEISVPTSELDKIEEIRGRNVLRAGLPVTIEVPLRKRTALQYAIEPISSALERSFHEH
jgi:HlyD family secretion protein